MNHNILVQNCIKRYVLLTWALQLCDELTDAICDTFMKDKWKTHIEILQKEICLCLESTTFIQKAGKVVIDISPQNWYVYENLDAVVTYLHWYYSLEIIEILDQILYTHCRTAHSLFFQWIVSNNDALYKEMASEFQYSSKKKLAPTTNTYEDSAWILEYIIKNKNL